MAPSATETVTLPTRNIETPQVKLTSNAGPYKELAPIGYEKEAEEKGKDGFHAAKVRIPLTPIPRDRC
jgi:sulfonate dioxygenase